MRIDIYFTEYFLAVQIDEKRKKIKEIKKKLNCTFIRINTSKENYDTDYDASRIQTFISNFNTNKIKKLEGKIKKLKL